MRKDELTTVSAAHKVSVSFEQVDAGQSLQVNSDGTTEQKINSAAINGIVVSVNVTGFGETLRMGFFQKIEFDAWLISSTIEPNLRPIAHFVVEIHRFVCDRATPPIIEKLRSKGVAMHAYGISAYYT